MAIEVPWQQLSADALDGLIEAYISRDGTDYGTVELSLETKKQNLRSQVEQGAVVIVFDEMTESCNLLSKQEWINLQQQAEANRSAEDEYFGL